MQDGVFNKSGEIHVVVVEMDLDREWAGMRGPTHRQPLAGRSDSGYFGSTRLPRSVQLEGGDV